MPDTKISALTAATAVVAANEFAINEAGVSKKVTASQIRAYTDYGSNSSAANQTITAATVTYLTGSGILIPPEGMVVGQMYRWYVSVNKTAAGIATPIWTLRVGTAQTTADATVLTITGTAQVATLSGTLIIITAQVRTVSATVGVVTGAINTGAASFGIGGAAVSGSITNNADAGKRFGVAVNSGASAAWTVNGVRGEIV